MSSPLQKALSILNEIDYEYIDRGVEESDGDINGKRLKQIRRAKREVQRALSPKRFVWTDGQFKIEKGKQ